MVVRSANNSSNSGSGRTLKRSGSGFGDGGGGGAGIGLVAGYKSSRILKKPTGSSTPDAEYDPHAERLRQDLKLMNNYSVKNLMKFESIKKSRNDGSGAGKTNTTLHATHHAQRTTHNDRQQLKTFFFLTKAT